MSKEGAARLGTRMVEHVGRELELDQGQRQHLGTLADALRAQRSALMGSTTDPRA